MTSLTKNERIIYDSERFFALHRGDEEKEK